MEVYIQLGNVSFGFTSTTMIDILSNIEKCENEMAMSNDVGGLKEVLDGLIKQKWDLFDQLIDNEDYFIKI